jgi:MFS family permease
VALSPDARRIISAQALRAAGYGCTSVLLGSLLAARGYGAVSSGILLACVVAGAAWGSLLLGRLGDRVGRRRWYAVIYLGVAGAGVAMAFGPPYWAILVLALAGVLSTDVVDNGPATTLEQVMLADEDQVSAGRSGVRVYGVYNAVASLAGALGALTAGLPTRLGAQADAGWPFAVLVPLGLGGFALATALSPRVEAAATPRPPMHGDAERSPVRRLAGLFAIDAGGGGLVTTSFLAYYLTVRYEAPPGALAVLFFTTSLLQAASV